MMTVTLLRPLIKTHPGRQEPDAGELMIVLPGQAPELHALGKTVDALCAEILTHDEFTTRLARVLPPGAQVTVRWRTGPWLVKALPGGAVTLYRPVIKQCPYRNETDTGELAITLPAEPSDLGPLGAAVGALCAAPVTHEEFTARLARTLPADAQVTTAWHTGPWDVEVTA
jgi:hypothetical protein